MALLFVFGKALGGLAGWFLGEIPGLLAGFLLGHALDLLLLRALRRRRQARQARQQGQHMYGTHLMPPAVIALAAKVAKADGRVSSAEIRAFQHRFPCHPADRRNIGDIFNRARRSPRGFQAAAEEVRAGLQARPDLLGGVISSLWFIASADGAPHPAQQDMIARTAEIFGFSDYEKEALRQQTTGPADPHTSSASSPGSHHTSHHAAQGPLAEAYALLGVAPDVDDAGLREAHRTLARLYHPDLLASRGLPERDLAAASNRLGAVNAAYEAVVAARRSAGAGHPRSGPWSS